MKREFLHSSPRHFFLVRNCSLVQLPLFMKQSNLLLQHLVLGLMSKSTSYYKRAQNPRPYLMKRREWSTLKANQIAMHQYMCRNLFDLTSIVFQDRAQSLRQSLSFRFCGLQNPIQIKRGDPGSYSDHTAFPERNWGIVETVYLAPVISTFVKHG